MKDKTSYVSSVVYDGKSNCGENYIDETGPNVTIRWDEHSDIGKNSESSLLTQPWWVRITINYRYFLLLSEDWPQGDNRQVSIPISDC